MRMMEHPARWETDACRYFNRFNRLRVASWLFGKVSRLGDGVFWYTLMIVLPVIYGFDQMRLSIGMLACGAASLLLYKLLKWMTQRPRPCDAVTMHRTVQPLDAFSFPSGHTMHAVGFTWMVVAHHPEWCWLLVPFSALVACSRLVLGLHYPSDVLVGAAIGALMANVFLVII